MSITLQRRSNARGRRQSNSNWSTVAVRRATAKPEETKKRRNEGTKEVLKRSGWRSVRQPDTNSVSAATRFARQGVREPQKQTAHDRVLLVFAILGLPCGRPTAGRGGP